uniref:beta-glucosidase n=1 Tax=uncultured bacterium contig00021 TaxID=1181511 RepID=A0A806K2B0_9BACT|nr:beta-glucosidase [uncultured bacterium contig00021]
MPKKYTMVEKDGYFLIHNEGGATLGISAGNKDAFIEADGYAFKDLNRNGILDPYEDWRLPFEERAADLAKRLSIEEIAGLMLYSPHQMLSMNLGFFAEIAKNKAPDTREHAWDLSEAQKAFLKDDNVRHVLVARVDNALTAAKWNNNAQAFVEGIGHGVPINTSSDPRHGIAMNAEFDMGAGSDISQWPEHIGLAAAFDPALVEEFGRIASKEYRAMGITTALSPQIDLATEPRWNRFNGTFGPGSGLVSDLAAAYCDGFQNSEGDKEIADGWGYESVNAMVKHWPGGGTGESGRDAHFGYGKYAVFPGNNLEEHLKPFTEGAFKLKGKTGRCSALMPYYTISYNIDKKYGENVGNSYSRYFIADMLRTQYGYDGVVCTDWNITHDSVDFESFISGKCWGVEDMTVADRHYKVLMAGVDQFGGNSDAKPVIEAYRKGAAEHGEEFMRKRMELSAVRLLRNIYRAGLFENPYLDAQESAKTVGCEEFMKKGYDAQLRSAVMLKNKNNVLPLAKKTKVYIPQRRTGAGFNWFGMPVPEKEETPIDKALVGKYFEIVDSPDQADCAFAFIISPANKGYTREEGYIPISLQYRPYTAVSARAQSIAVPGDNRSYKGKTVATRNEPHLDMVLDVKKAMGNKPVVVFIKMMNPAIVAEFEKAADAIIVDFAVKPEALMDIVSGKAEPSALLPFLLPKDMDTVERHNEDMPFDMEPHLDECGNLYDFAFGLNWGGVIKDERVRKYGIRR